MIGATITDSSSQAGNTHSKLLHRTSLIEGLLIFLGAAVLLFLVTSRVVNIFDEGNVLTAVMRTMAGQVVHRDFYYNYGPAHLYLIAGIFKLFGPSVLTYRLAAIFFNACLVVSLYVMARRLCGRATALGAVFVCVLWQIGIGIAISVLNASLCTLTLWTSWLILPVIGDRMQRRRAFGAGFLTGILFLCRYDIGVGMVAVILLAVAIMRWLQVPAARRSPRRLVATTIVPYLAAFAAIAIPFVVAYLSVAPLHDLLYDTILYGGTPYRVGRGLPFPRPHMGQTFQEIAVYLLPIIIAFGFWAAIRCVIARRKDAGDRSATGVPAWMNLLVPLCTAATMTYAKGLVRIGVGGMYGSVIDCVLIAALLVTHRASFNIWLRGLLTATIGLFVIAAISSTQVRLLEGHHLRPLAINWILTPGRQPPSAEFRSWCHDGTPITRGFCFVLDGERIETVRYLRAHTHPGDYLYVGLDHHDRIFMNDNIIYFAVQLLPAVRWSQLDPLVEDRADIQRDMIDGLEKHKAPYVVLDSEFDNMSEPNGSSISSGVHLLDNYIATHYKAVQQYGHLTILQRQGESQ